MQWLSTPEILESGDIKAFVHAEDPSDLEFFTEDVIINWPRELENESNVNDTTYKVMIRGITVESMDLYDQDDITKVIEEFIGLNASKTNSLTTHDDIRNIYWYKDYRPGRWVGSAILHFGSHEKANDAIVSGVFWDGEHHGPWGEPTSAAVRQMSTLQAQHCVLPKLSSM